MARRRFFVDEIHRDEATITGADAHHLTRVLRVEEGQQFEISDNERVYLATVTEARKTIVRFEVVSEIAAEDEPLRAFLLASLIKFDRLEWMIEKATELGVSTIVPVDAERSEHGLLRAASKRVERWRKIAKESAQQSRRLRIPEIADPCELSNAIRDSVFSDALRLRLEEEGAPESLLAVTLRHFESANVGANSAATNGAKASSERPAAALLVGPEGGWTDAERGTLDSAGWPGVSLGSRILRAETAAIAGLAVWQQAAALSRSGIKPDKSEKEKAEGT